MFPSVNNYLLAKEITYYFQPVIGTPLEYSFRSTELVSRIQRQHMYERILG